ncbi:hypothetical protein CEXT_515761 [Caerostris extrusa]|uniref:Uncharacterized protein n=1 Tax=Caerostris extrusa TaxID=172846 RepID=A0AAV4N9Y8_CAEEX|nr:hypothetical protein CEXT_515761 [Caerostris extrusa]
MSTLRNFQPIVAKPDCDEKHSRGNTKSPPCLQEACRKRKRESALSSRHNNVKPGKLITASPAPYHSGRCPSTSSRIPTLRLRKYRGSFFPVQGKKISIQYLETIILCWESP